MFSGHYRDWQRTRVRLVDEIVMQDSSRKSGKWPTTLLELGAGHGDFSQYFTQKGLVCTAAEGRPEHVKWMQKNTEISSVIQFDAERPWLEHRKYDVVLHFGLLYHLEKPLENLNWCLDNIKFDIMFLETEVSNHDDPEFVLVLREEGYDQGLANLGGRPTPAGIEAVLDSKSLEWVRIDSPDLDSGIHKYSWKAEDTPYTWAHGLRRLYLIRRKGAGTDAE
jgi:hypothetical protein